MKRISGSRTANDKRVGIESPTVVRPELRGLRRYLLPLMLTAVGLVGWFTWSQLRRDEPPAALVNRVSEPRIGEPPRESSDRGTPHNLSAGQDQPRSGDAIEQEVKSLKDEARGIAELLVATFPEDAYCHDVLAAVQYRLFGDAARADELWKTAIKLDHRFAASYFGRMNIAWSHGDFDTVVELMRQVLDRNPSSLEARLYLGNALIELGRFEEAIEALKPGDPTAAESVRSYLLLGKASMQLDDYAKAVQFYESAVQLNPQCREAYYGLAQACQRLARGEEARRHLQKFQSLEADEASADDRSAYKRLIESDATLVRQEVVATCLAAGEICQHHGDLMGTERYWLRAAELDPRDPRSRQALRQLYEQQGRLREAADIISQLRALQSALQRGG